MLVERLPVLGRLTGVGCAAPLAVRIVLGVIGVVVGIALVGWPFEALTVVAVVVPMAVADLVLGAVRRRPPLAVCTAALVVVGGVALLFAGSVVSVLAVVGPVAFIAAGVGAAVRGPDRTRHIIEGAVAVVAGVLGLLWPDIGEYVLAVLVGLAVAAAGLWLIIDSRSGRRVTGRLPGRVAAGFALTVTLLALCVGMLFAPPLSAAPGAPGPAPAGPGALISADQLTSGLTASMRGWRIVYTTERDDGSPTVASAYVVIDGDPTVSRPVVAWAHGTTGYTGACGPSSLPDPLLSGAAGASAVVLAAIRQGSAVVATDYPGLGTPGPQPYLIGRGEGRAVLDAVRAARAVPGLVLRDQVLIWGHSQGGHAALWAGAIAPEYAPDLAVAGVVAMAPATNLPAIVADLDRVSGGTIFLAYVLRAYADTYPDVSVAGLVKPGGDVVVNALAGRCLTAPAALVSFGSSTSLGSLLARPIDGTTFAAHLQQNVPVERIAAPVLIEQGSADTIVRQPGQDTFVRQLCGTGTTVDYRTYAGRDHTGLVAADSPALSDMLSWSRDRLTTGPAPSGC